MFIAIHTAGMPFNGATIPTGQSLGGSESASYYMAKELVKLGHHVTVFTNHQHKNADGAVVGQWWDGVLYEWLGTASEQYPLGDRFHAVMQAPFDVVIIQRHPMAFQHKFNSKINIWWLHDLALHVTGGLVQQHLLNIDRIFTVSKWHKDQVSKVYGIPEDTIINTTNGVDYEMFEGLDGYEREPRSLFYMARPERGLENLVGTDSPIMEQLKDCHLYVCGYNNTMPNMKDYYEYLWRRCDELPNVTNLGHLGKRELYEAMAKAQLYVYPTTFEDTSCIAALEANAAGLPVIGSDWSAVPETMTDAGCVLLPLKDGKVDKDGFVKAVRNVLSVPTLYESLKKKAMTKRQTWADAAKQWDQVFTDLLKEKSSDGLRMALHLEQMSDIVAADKGGLTGWIPDFDKNYEFYKTGDYAGHYARYYEYEAGRGVNYGPESLQGNPRFETIAAKVFDVKPKTVMDFGCAHGHYVMNILARVPLGSMHITGIDIDRSNIEKAEAWARQANFTEYTKFLQGSLEELKARPDMMFDCIICSEMLEHVPNPQDYINELVKHLNPNGTFIGSTPYGPWEAIGYKDHPGWRAHLHHFERQDLNEMFAGFDGYKLIAVPWQGDLGHYVFT
ncbi:MAG TPA: methyltransferase domain-containing protein, partial [Deltaproteobacteria bacterium]|nr:methyltransferase domain-containing protein [Deltaproteobacteria bacterium]